MDYNNLTPEQMSAFAGQPISLDTVYRKLLKIEKDISNLLDAPVKVQIAKPLNEFNIGDTVEINTNSEYYGDWVGIKHKVVGINLHTRTNKIEYTLMEGISTSDGWDESELSKAII